LLVAVGTGVLVRLGVDDGLEVEVGKGALVGLRVDVAGALGVDVGAGVLMGPGPSRESVRGDSFSCVGCAGVDVWLETGVPEPARVPVFVGMTLAALVGDAVPETDISDVELGPVEVKGDGVLVWAGLITGIVE